MDIQPAFSTHCHLCGLEVDVPELYQHQCADCPRCGNNLSQHKPNSVAKSLSFAMSGIVFLLLSLPYGFLSFASKGQSREITLPSGLLTLVDLDYFALAFITIMAMLIIPCLVLIGLITLNLARIRGRKPNGLIPIYKMFKRLRPWSMAEIFLVGTVVSLIKITDLATIDIGMSFVAFCLFMMSLSAAAYYFDDIEFERWLGPKSNNRKAITVETKQKSIQSTWALLLTSFLLYIPANLYPIMSTQFFGSIEPNTILGGVLHLWKTGSYPIAIVIFFASVAVPIAKLLVLAWLNWSVQRNSNEHQKHRTITYHITESIGRWSMIDVFVVAVLVALIQLGNTISIFPGAAVLAFCAVVFFTMLAANSFDSRLIWLREDKTL